MSPWEKQLESWTPRPPSAKLKQQLFGAKREISRSRSVRMPVVLGWLAPATCMLALCLNVWVAHSNRPAYLSAIGGSNMIAGLTLPRAVVLNYSPDTRAQENIWAVATSDPGVGRSLTATSSFPLWKTNVHF